MKTFMNNQEAFSLRRNQIMEWNFFGATYRLIYGVAAGLLYSAIWTSMKSIKSEIFHYLNSSRSWLVVEL